MVELVKHLNNTFPAAPIAFLGLHYYSLFFLLYFLKVQYDMLSPLIFPFLLPNYDGKREEQTNQFLMKKIHQNKTFPQCWIKCYPPIFEWATNKVSIKSNVSIAYPTQYYSQLLLNGIILICDCATYYMQIYYFALLLFLSFLFSRIPKQQTSSNQGQSN